MEQWLMSGGANSLTMVSGLIIILAAGAKGIWLFGFQHRREMDALIQNHTTAMARLETILMDERAAAEKRVTDIRVHYEARLDDRTIDRDEWRDIARQAANIGARVTDVASTVAGQKGSR